MVLKWRIIVRIVEPRQPKRRRRALHIRGTPAVVPFAVDGLHRRMGRPVTRRTWFLVTVTLTWDASDGAAQGDERAGRRLDADRILDLLLEQEDMAGARVTRAVELGPASMYYRIDVHATSEDDARERAIVAGMDVARTLGSTASVTDVQTLNEVELGDYQASITYRRAPA
jgi:hypothetical protein